MDAQPDWQLIANALQMRIQVNSNIAELYVAYGAIAVGLIALTLPQLVNNSEVLSKLTKWRRIVFQGLFWFGLAGLLIGSAIFFWLSRYLTIVNNNYPTILHTISVTEEALTSTDTLETKMHSVETQVYPFTEIFKHLKVSKQSEATNQLKGLAAVAKIADAAGVFCYGMALLIFLMRWMSSCWNQDPKNRSKSA
ncbi:MAG: hypothetical protein GWN55_09780 [Phycisphaerae bacterium]|nr:hypothetical protein [candidate division KSB1 bacterium]NIV01593.1 hypothetical protein [Phycisphaerae bacterium]NIS25889.1 hypothetical protein [candidate division KSB1 bacterium]NIT72765.1 hypothetical protein [candidate division KSB1 bacterium]NIU26577.1 hypothetical protein [candidate division KSB1 bacterium]